MELDAFLARLQRDRATRQQIYHVGDLPERPASFADLPLEPRVAASLAARGIHRLYTHQAEAIGHVRAGRSVVVVTGTASGKTLCYNIPILEALQLDPSATALAIYPTKALAQDQFRGLSDLAAGVEGLRLVAGPYDGDTPAPQRRKLRDRGSVILTNPDMLHQGILPNHARWARFFTNLRYVVLDEVHAYRGVFGSHVANVIRRMRRICKHFGSTPLFICSSATIANPREHAERIIGGPAELVTNDGSPRGPKKFLLWNPPLLSRDRPANEQPAVGGERRSALWTAVELLADLVRRETQTIVFSQTRLSTELILKHARTLLEPHHPRLATRVQSYRGGYLPEERRDIERRLASGEILGITSTNALELGIDIGSLDACILVGYPGTIASLWQRAGRAGRGADHALVILVAQNSPIDQYLMYNPAFIFGRSPERAVIDPDNPHIAVGHIKCALHELPLPDADVESFGPYAEPILELLADGGVARHIEGKWYWASGDYPAAETNLRTLCGPVYTIQDTTKGDQVIGTMDEISALAQLHDHAVYIHSGDTYIVNKLDLEKKIAFVERRDLDYYTQSIQSSQIRIDARDREQPWGASTVGLGDVTVTTHIPMFKKVKFSSRDSLGFEKLELPPQELETVAMWLVPSDEARQRVAEQGRVFAEGLIGIANAMVEVAPMFVMCDVQDIGTTVDATNLGKDAIFLYDRYPGGMGYAERCAEAIEGLLKSVHTVVSQCACRDGCPSCVGAAVPAFALSDLDSSVRGRIPDKQAALLILHDILGLAPYIAQPKPHPDMPERLSPAG
ncbi:MAG TPA: DEAD/DEAH box helicase [Planctomycetota bacterium]|nr:DEAD/DEAH box helicase [Planctomycetota bacterium]HRR79264.1 DEAD/DEAH box helicase [Planctomycetota bacterium]